MSVIQTVTDLQSAIVEYLARDQDTTLIARVPSFIQLFEAKMNRNLFVRQMETRAQAQTIPSTVVASTGATATTSNVLQFASIPSTVVAGANAFDSTTNQQLGTVQSTDPLITNTVTLTANVASAVSIGDNIMFGTLEPEFVALPADFQTMRRIRMTSDVRKTPLEYITPTQMDEYRAKRADTEGRPRFFTIFGNEIELFPTPGIAVTLEMIYRQNIPSLNANASNWLLTLAPDAYLYGSLMESAPYIKEDNRIAVWGAGMTSAMTDLNNLGNNSTFNAGPLQVRVNHRVF